MRQAFAGIDVAFAKGKRLPIVVWVQEGRATGPLLLRDFQEALPPRGRGIALSANTRDERFMRFGRKDGELLT